MNKIVNIAIVGLGQVGIYLYNELRLKKKEIDVSANTNRAPSIFSKHTCGEKVCPWQKTSLQTGPRLQVWFGKKFF